MMTHDDQPAVPPPVIMARPISYAPAEAEVVPWERSEGNWLRRWWESVVMAMFHPAAFFALVRNGRRLDRAILFFCMLLALDTFVAPWTTGVVEGSILHSAWDGLAKDLPHLNGMEGINEEGDLDLSRLLPNVLPPESGGHARQRTPRGPIDPQSLQSAISGLSGAVKVFSVVSQIVFGFVSLFATAAMFQAAAWMFIPTRRKFADTLRVVAYAHAPLVWGMVPMVGGLVFLVWLSVLIIMGLRVVHGTTRARVVAALSFWPTLILLTVGLACAVVIRQALSTVNI